MFPAIFTNICYTIVHLDYQWPSIVIQKHLLLYRGEGPSFVSDSTPFYITLNKSYMHNYLTGIRYKSYSFNSLCDSELSLINPKMYYRFASFDICQYIYHTHWLLTHLLTCSGQAVAIMMKIVIRALQKNLRSYTSHQEV